MNKEVKDKNKHIFANVNDDVLLRSNAMNYAEAQEYKQRIDRANEFCDYLLSNDEVAINNKTYIKQISDDIITKAIKSKLLGGDE